MRRALITLVFLATGVVGTAWAVEPDEVLSDPGMEARARALSAELRCMVCQNQSIDDSNADLAKDLRVLLRERIKAGDSDDQVRDFLVERYGDFILLKPRLKAQTILLWAAAPAVLVIGIVVLVLARRRGTIDSRPLSPEEQATLRQALDRDR